MTRDFRWLGLIRRNAHLITSQYMSRGPRIYFTRWGSQSDNFSSVRVVKNTYITWLSSHYVAILLVVIQLTEHESIEHNKCWQKKKYVLTVHSNYRLWHTGDFQGHYRSQHQSFWSEIDNNMRLIDGFSCQNESKNMAGPDRKNTKNWLLDR